MSLCLQAAHQALSIHLCLPRRQERIMAGAAARGLASARGTAHRACTHVAPPSNVTRT